MLVTIISARHPSDPVGGVPVSRSRCRNRKCRNRNCHTRNCHTRNWPQPQLEKMESRHRMDPKVLYWTFAFSNMGLVVGLGLYGASQLKAGNPRRHRAMMITATCLVVGFVISYACKLYFLGREDLSVWSNLAIWVLRFHETCVLTMVVGGGLGLRWGKQLRATRSFSLNPEDPLAENLLVQRHRRAGQVALAGASLGFVSAGFVLAGMYLRTGA